MSALDVAKWWEDVAAADAEAATRKMSQYGSLDLVAIGEQLYVMMGQIHRSAAEKAEIGCAFYALGKLARAMEAYRCGKQPSDDTWHDLTVYSMMVRRIRESGAWS